MEIPERNQEQIKNARSVVILMVKEDGSVGIVASPNLPHKDYHTMLDWFSRQHNILYPQYSDKPEMVKKPNNN